MGSSFWKIHKILIRIVIKTLMIQIIINHYSNIMNENYK